MDTSTKIEAFDEFEAMKNIDDQLKRADNEARSRILSYMLDKYGSSNPSLHRRAAIGTATYEVAAGTVAHQKSGIAPYATFAELYDATRPESQSDKALVGGYWLQVCGGAEDFPSQDVNNLLKNLGEGVGNITQALENLKAAKPGLVLQLKKSGKSKQSRKTYKLTVAGIKSIEAMIRAHEERDAA